MRLGAIPLFGMGRLLKANSNLSDDVLPADLEPLFLPPPTLSKADATASTDKEKLSNETFAFVNEHCLTLRNWFALRRCENLRRGLIYNI